MMPSQQNIFKNKSLTNLRAQFPKHNVMEKKITKPQLSDNCSRVKYLPKIEKLEVP